MRMIATFTPLVVAAVGADDRDAHGGGRGREVGGGELLMRYAVRERRRWESEGRDLTSHFPRPRDEGEGVGPREEEYDDDDDDDGQEEVVSDESVCQAGAVRGMSCERLRC